MDIKKTLRYNWEFGRETVAIRVSSYRNNGNLYVGLCHKEGREWENGLLPEVVHFFWYLF